VFAGWTDDLSGQRTSFSLAMSNDLTAIGQAGQLKPDQCLRAPSVRTRALIAGAMRN